MTQKWVWFLHLLFTLAGFFQTLILPSHLHAVSPREAEAKNAPVNRLARESSPYLLQHAHNPVDWYPWGTEAFERAKKENKLVFVSIGYSSCYWCHVMERESFSNPEVAKLLNQWFVCIKVDREERPDVDAVYMSAVNTFGRRGGWPLSMFLTADGKPFFGDTYWPREDRTVETENGPAKIAGFKSVLALVHDLQVKEPEKLRQQADLLASRTTESLNRTQRGISIVDLNRDLVKESVAVLKKEYDDLYGGFGNADKNFLGTKFPLPTNLGLLLQQMRRPGTSDLAEMVSRTLDNLGRGGIFDQVGGGFHRYSTERTWSVPHFEKMLYDNAQLVEIYAEAFGATRKPFYAQIVQRTLDFIDRELTSPEGAFFSALDAETNGEEGRYYVWTPEEIRAALPNKDERELIKKVLSAGEEPKFESKYHIFRLSKPWTELAKEVGLGEKELRGRVAPLLEKLAQVRSRRPHPFLDRKILTGWNGLMIGGLAVAGKELKNPVYLEKASRAADFVLRNLRRADGRLLRSYGSVPGKPAEGRLNAYLDDYAFLVHGLLCLDDATGDKKWLREAQKLTDIMIRFHQDQEKGGFFFTSSDHEKLFARSKDQYDGVQPSGNSMAAKNLVRLWTKTGQEKYQVLSEKTLKAFSGTLQANPSAMTFMAQALDLFLDAREGRGERTSAKPESISQGGATRSESKVKASATVDPKTPGADGNQVVTITLAIENKWHVYANPVPQDFPGVPTTVTVSAKTQPEVKIEYPEGRLVKDPDGDHRVYEDKVIIKATVHRNQADSSPLEVSIKIQACSDKTCLLPSTLKLTVP